MADGVKGSRRYDSARRRAAAAQARERIIDEAERMFLRDGYASTTIAAIADGAGVSVETVYKTCGGKAGLLRAIRERALRGRGPMPAEERSDAIQARERDPRAVIRAWGELTAEVAPLVAPILLLIRDAAASDPELASLQREMDRGRLRRMTDNARYLYDGGHLRSGITLKDAADVLWTYSSPDLYELLVIRRRWPLSRYGEFVTRSMIGALLP